MAITITAKYSNVNGSTSAQTMASGALSFTSGNTVLVVGHGLRDNHTNGFGAQWTVTDNAATNNPDWSQIGVTGILDWGGGTQYAIQTIALVSTALTASESFTVTADAHSGGTSLFFYGLQVFEIVNYGSTTDTADGSAAGGSGTATFGAAPSGHQMIVGMALSSFDDIVWGTPPATFATITGSTATPVGGMGASAVQSTTNTTAALAWSYTSTSNLGIDLLALEIAEGGAVQPHLRRVMAPTAAVIRAATW